MPGGCEYMVTGNDFTESNTSENLPQSINNNYHNVFGKKFQWNFNRYTNILIQENAFENDAYEMSILSRPHCVNRRC